MNELNIVWKILEDAGVTAVHSYRDSKDGNRWYCQLLHPDKDRVNGLGNTYADALMDAYKKY